jgi:hypothetical protein
MLAGVSYLFYIKDDCGHSKCKYFMNDKIWPEALEKEISSSPNFVHHLEPIVLTFCTFSRAMKLTH